MNPLALYTFPTGPFSTKPATTTTAAAKTAAETTIACRNDNAIHVNSKVESVKLHPIRSDEEVLQRDATVADSFTTAESNLADYRPNLSGIDVATEVTNGEPEQASTATVHVSTDSDAIADALADEVERTILNDGSYTNAVSARNNDVESEKGGNSSTELEMQEMILTEIDRQEAIHGEFQWLMLLHGQEKAAEMTEKMTSNYTDKKLKNWSVCADVTVKKDSDYVDKSAIPDYSEMCPNRFCFGNDMASPATQTLAPRLPKASTSSTFFSSPKSIASHKSSSQVSDGHGGNNGVGGDGGGGSGGGGGGSGGGGKTARSGSRNSGSASSWIGKILSAPAFGILGCTLFTVQHEDIKDEEEEVEDEQEEVEEEEEVMQIRTSKRSLNGMKYHESGQLVVGAV